MADVKEALGPRTEAATGQDKATEVERQPATSASGRGLSAGLHAPVLR